MTVCGDAGLSCLSGLSGAGQSSDPDHSPGFADFARRALNTHNSQRSESKLVAAEAPMNDAGSGQVSAMASPASREA